MKIEKFYTIVYDSLYRKYGRTPDVYIQNRVIEELEAIKRHKAICDVTILYELTDWFKTNNIPYVMRNATGSSLIFYLLEITSSNPLPLHSYCPLCNKVYWNSLEHYCTTDNTTLIRDGYDIPWQTLWGYGDCFFQFKIGLPINSYNEVFDYLSTINAEIYEGYEDKAKKINASRISCVFLLDSTKKCEHIKNILDLDLCEQDSSKKLYAVDTFIRNGNIHFSPEPIAFQDDVYKYLLTHGFTSEEAWKGMRRVSQGRG